MDAELLTIPGCPHAASAYGLFATALKLEGLTETIMIREVATEEKATQLSFHGSPEFRINGNDLFPSDAEPAVTCRVYHRQGKLSGEPDLDTLQAALRDFTREHSTPG